MGLDCGVEPVEATTSSCNTKNVFSWDPSQYQRYGGLRLRPALDLLAQVDHPDPQLIYDVGTGRGDMARLMAERWPQARVIGTDTSAEMLNAAAETASRVEWVEADVADWAPRQAPDIIFSNAVLHWVEDHESVFARLAESLAPGGSLAVQMPLSWGEPSHRLMRETLTAGSMGTEALRSGLSHAPVGDAGFYHRLLSPHFESINIWITRYLQVLTGDDAVFEWVSGTALRPVLAALDDEDRSLFIDTYKAALSDVYPTDANGTTLFPFPRLFIVANRRLASRIGPVGTPSRRA